MLRITKMEEGLSSVTLKLEGRIATDWVPLLERECLRCLREGGDVNLDFFHVTFVDRRGIEMLARIASESLRIINCSDLMRELLEEGEA